MRYAPDPRILPASASEREKEPRMTDTASRGAPPGSSRDDRNLAYAAYGLMFAAPFVFGLTGLIAVVIAYVRKSDAEPLTATHYGFQIRIFWLAFILAIIAALSLMIGMGVLIWSVITGVMNSVPQDAWEAVALEVEPRFPVASIIGFVVFLTAYILSSLTAIVGAALGAIRLGADRPMGRLA